MTDPHHTDTGDIEPAGSRRGELKSYALGGMLSLVLTVVAFAAVILDFDSTVAILVIAAAALLQIAVHLRCFLHLGVADREAREDLLLVLFSVLLLTIMAGGTVWILSDLSGRMHEPQHHQIRQ